MSMFGDIAKEVMNEEIQTNLFLLITETNNRSELTQDQKNLVIDTIEKIRLIVYQAS